MTFNNSKKSLFAFVFVCSTAHKEASALKLTATNNRVRLAPLLSRIPPLPPISARLPAAAKPLAEEQRGPSPNSVADRTLGRPSTDSVGELREERASELVQLAPAGRSFMRSSRLARQAFNGRRTTETRPRSAGDEPAQGSLPITREDAQSTASKAAAERAAALEQELLEDEILRDVRYTTSDSSEDSSSCVEETTIPISDWLIERERRVYGAANDRRLDTIVAATTSPVAEETGTSHSGMRAMRGGQRHRGTAHKRRISPDCVASPEVTSLRDESDGIAESRSCPDFAESDYGSDVEVQSDDDLAMLSYESLDGPGVLPMRALARVAHLMKIHGRRDDDCDFEYLHEDDAEQYYNFRESGDFDYQAFDAFELFEYINEEHASRTGERAISDALEDTRDAVYEMFNLMEKNAYGKVTLREASFFAAEFLDEAKRLGSNSAAMQILRFKALQSRGELSRAECTLKVKKLRESCARRRGSAWRE